MIFEISSTPISIFPRRAVIGWIDAAPTVHALHRICDTSLSDLERLTLEPRAKRARYAADSAMAAMPTASAFLYARIASLDSRD